MKTKHLYSLSVPLLASLFIGSLVMSTPATTDGVATVIDKDDENDSAKLEESPSVPPANARKSDAPKDPLTDIAEAWEQMMPVKDGAGNVILPTPGTNRGANAQPDDRPILPLDWDTAPYPPEHHPEIDKFLDKRSAKDRYLGLPPSNVDDDNNVAGVPDLKSYYGHPGVQPRTHRSQHYRLNVANTDNVPFRTVKINQQRSQTG